MAVRVFGCNHIVLEVGDLEKAVAFYKDVFNLEHKNEGEGDAFFKLGNHQFLALFQSDEPHIDDHRHFGLIVRDRAQVAEVREKITQKYGLKIIPITAF
jgi:catechol-2,3-dioxygenase